MSKKILLVSGGTAPLSELMLMKLKEGYGDDIILVTPEEAMEKGIPPSEFANIPTYKITPHPPLPEMKILGTPASGKELRRKRRERERKAKKVSNNQ